MRVSPCLFLGIGTTGLRMLDELRQLFYEEFGVGGLPCFQYLVLETDKDSKSREFLPHRPQDYERVNVIPITIRSLSAVKLTPTLDGWLDRRTLNVNQRNYENGAGHRRQAGRLCLWENWAAVSQQLIRAIGAIQSIPNRDQTDQWLRANYFRYRRPDIPLPEESLVDPVPRIYLVGTLCGGTCSGTFIDLAYFFHTQVQVRTRAQLRDLGTPEIIGLFTIPDTRTMAQAEHLPHVTSWWAALTELDFYSKDDTFYEVEFPDGTSVRTREAPFSTVYLEGKVNTGRVGFPAEEGGNNDLVQMCAMNLFTETVAGLADIKAANRVNLPAAGAGFLTLDEGGYLRGFSAFGLSAIWYPRYRIAKAIARRLSLEMARDWLGSQQPQLGKVNEAVAADWQKAIDRARASLLGSATESRCSLPLEATITDLFDRREPEFKALDPEGLEEFVLNFPGGDATLGQKLNPGGEYYRHVAYAQNLVASDLKDQLAKMTSDYVRTHTFAEATAYVRGLCKSAEDLEEHIAEDLPAFSQKLDLAFAPQVYEDRSAWLVGLRGQAVAEFQEAKWAEFKEHALQHLGLIRDHFLKRAVSSILENLRALIQEVQTAEANLGTLRDQCVREHALQIRLTLPSNLVLTSVGNPNTIEDDVDLGASEILTTESPDRLRASFLEANDALALLRAGPNDLLARLDQKYDHLIQPVVTRFQIGREALEGMVNRLRDLVFSSAPYFEPTQDWSPMSPPQPPNFIFCHDVEAGGRLAERAGEYLLGTRYDPRVSPLDHFVFFYQETQGVAADELQVSTYARGKLEEVESVPGSAEPTRFTHKLGKKMFDPAALYQAAQQWIEDARALVPEAFALLNDEPYIQYQSADGTKADLYVAREESVRSYLKESGLQGLVRFLGERLAERGRDDLVRRMDARRAKAPSPPEREAVGKRHQEILQTVFPPRSGRLSESPGGRGKSEPSRTEAS